MGAGVVLAAGVAGGSVGAIEGTRRSSHGGSHAPQNLVDAVQREQILIATIDASVSADPAKRVRLAPLRADHVAHLDAVQALLTRAAPGATHSRPPAPAADLLTAVRAAQASGAAAAAATTGALAALLASISACEAGHAVLLG